MRLTKGVRFLAAPAIACTFPLTSAMAVPIPNSDVLQWYDQVSPPPPATPTYTYNNPETGGCEGNCYVTTSIQLVGANASPVGTGIYFTEHGTGSTGPKSDYVFTCHNPAGAGDFICFSSDDENGNLTLPAGISASGFTWAGAETGDFMTITSYFSGYCFNQCGSGAEGSSILRFASDVDSQGVPEPATWVVMLTGLLSLFGFGALRKRADA